MGERKGSIVALVVVFEARRLSVAARLWYEDGGERRGIEIHDAVDRSGLVVDLDGFDEVRAHAFAGVVGRAVAERIERET